MLRRFLAAFLAVALLAAPAFAQQSVIIKTDGLTVGSSHPLAVTGTTTSTPATVGHGTAAAAARVELPTDGTGVVGLNAGEAHVGEVGSNQITVTVAQTVTASSAYTAGNAVGGLITFANAARVSGTAGASGTSGLLQSVIVQSKSAQTTQLDLLVFNANPSGSTCTDKSAVSVAAADFNKWIGTAHVTDWTSGGTPSNGQAQNLAMPYTLSSATSLYGCLVTRATPTFAATTDISVVAGFLRQ